MPRTINPIRKARLKKELLKNNGDAKNAMLKAGFAPATAHNATSKKIVQACQLEITKELTKKIDVDYVLNELERIKKLAEENKDFSTAARNVELLGKYLAMFTDKQQVKSDINITSDEQSELNRLRILC